MSQTQTQTLMFREPAAEAGPSGTQQTARMGSTLSLFESRVDSTIDSLLDFMDRADMPQGMRSFEWV